MMERCKPIMTFLMIVIASLMIFKTEGTRTSKQLYVSPYHLENSPIVVPHVPYWTQYYYPVPAEYPPMYEQPTLENLQLVENLTNDYYLNSLIEQHPEAFTRQGPIISFFQSLFSGGRPFLTFWQNLLGIRPNNNNNNNNNNDNTNCPSCPTCVAVTACPTCVTTAAALASATFKTCETNGFSPASTGTITLALLTDTTAVCKYFIAVQDPKAIARVQCTATSLGTGGIVVASPANALSVTTPVVTSTAIFTNGGNNRLGGLQISLSNFFGIAIANKNANGGSATCSWDVQTSTTTTAFTTCVQDGFSYANTGTITLTGLTSTTAICQYVIATSIPVAQFSVKCTPTTLGTGGAALGFTIPELTDNTKTGVTLDATDKLVASNVIAITITNKNAAGGAATCSWDFGPTTPAAALTACTTIPTFSARSSGTITLSTTTLNIAKACTFNVASTNPAATIKVTCAAKDLAGAGGGDVTVTSENKLPVTVPVDATGVTSTSNYVSIIVDNKKNAGSATCSWTITP